MVWLCAKAQASAHGVGVLIIAAALLLFSSGGRAAASGERLVAAYSSISGTQMVLWISYDLGMFERAGVKTDLVFAGSGAKSIQIVLAGDARITQVSGAGVVSANLRGADVVLFAGVVNRYPYVFLTGREITRPEQLRGKRVGITGLGGSSEFAMRLFLERLGLNPDRDVTMLSIGGQSVRLAALRSGSVQATILEPPASLAARKAGMNQLADFTAIRQEVQHIGMAATRQWLNGSPELARRFTQGVVLGIHALKTRKEESLRVLRRYMKLDDPEALEDAYKELAVKVIPRKPYPSLEGIAYLVQQEARREKRAEGARPERFVDLRFVKELDESGFIDKLYGGRPEGGQP